ncbi:MAG TPA: hypothetical protein VNL36_02915 [Bacteroidota bacterium]|nr:hypothetical protein [Bacteroidota bacterium]
MKAALYSLVFAVTMLMGERNLLKNGDFEKFVGGEPQNWETNNIPSMLVVVSSSTVSSSGKTSVRCEVKNLSGTMMAGLVRQKNIPVVAGDLQLSGAYLLKSVGKDAGFVSIDVKSKSESTIATCEHYLTRSSSEFVPFTLNTRLPSGARTIDLVLTLIAPEGESLHEGSYIHFDALELSVRPASTVQPQ